MQVSFGGNGHAISSTCSSAGRQLKNGAPSTAHDGAWRRRWPAWCRPPAAQQWPPSSAAPLQQARIYTVNVGSKLCGVADDVAMPTTLQPAAKTQYAASSALLLPQVQGSISHEPHSRAPPASQTRRTRGVSEQQQALRGMARQVRGVFGAHRAAGRQRADGGGQPQVRLAHLAVHLRRVRVQPLLVQRACRCMAEGLETREQLAARCLCDSYQTTAQCCGQKPVGD